MSIHEFQPDRASESEPKGPAVILQHSSAAVVFDAPAHGFDPVDDEAMAVLDAAEALTRLAASLGSYARVSRLLRNLAYSHGEEV